MRDNAVDFPRIVFLPGILGSCLHDPTAPAVPGILGKRGWDARDIWGRPGMLLWLTFPGPWTRRILQGNGLDDPGAVTAPGLTRLLNTDPYTSHVEMLRQLGDVLEFPYDWRLSNHLHGPQLRQAIIDHWFGGRAEPPPPDERLTIVAHSMGGLVARYFVEGLDGHRWVKRVIMVGTPQRGSPSAYTHFRGLTVNFGARLDLAAIKRLLHRVSRGSARNLPRRVHVSYMLPPGMQRQISRSQAGTLQLMPRYPVVVRGGHYVPIEESMAGLVHPPTGMAVHSVIDLLLAGLRDDARLNTWLDLVDVRYDVLGGTGRRTLQGYDEDHKRLLRSADGDGVVPLHSSLLPAGQRIGVASVSGIAHDELMTSLTVQTMVAQAVEAGGARGFGADAISP